MNLKENILRFRTYLERFVPLSDEQWNVLSPLLSSLVLKKKEFFMQPHSPQNRIGFIMKGLLRTYFISDKGEEYTTDFCRENEIAVNYRLTSSGDDDYYTQAVIETELLFVDYNTLSRSGLSGDLWKNLQSRIVEYYHPLKLEREKSLLSMDAREKYLAFQKKYAGIVEDIPQYQIASYLGITPIALSRVKKAIKTEI